MFSEKGRENKGKSPVSNINQSCLNSKFPGSLGSYSYPTLFRQEGNRVFFPPSRVEHVGCSLLGTSITEASRWYTGASGCTGGRYGAACAIKVVGGTGKKKKKTICSDTRNVRLSMFVTLRDELRELNARNTPSSYPRGDVPGKKEKPFL